MRNAKQPFSFGRVLDVDELVDRKDELALITRRLQSGARHFLIGPRRFGKTSLLHAAADAATRAGTPTLLVNAESFVSLETLAAGLVAEAAKLIAPTFKERLLGITEWFPAIKPQAEYNAMTDSIKVSVAPSGSAPSVETLTEVLNSLDALAASRGHLVGVVIDEFQVLHELGGLQAERTLRAVVQEHRHLSYVFAGSHTRMMLAMITEHARPFYRLGDSQYLGPVPRKEFANFIEGEFRARGNELQPDAVARIFEVCEDVPYNIQRLAAELWELDVAEPSEGELTVHHLEAALTQLITRAHPNYLALYLTLTTTQRKVIAGMAKLPNLNGAVSHAARTIQVAASTYRTAQKSFLDSDLLHERFDGQQAARQYAFVDPFFKGWLRQFVYG